MMLSLVSVAARCWQPHAAGGFFNRQRPLSCCDATWCTRACRRLLGRLAPFNDVDRIASCEHCDSSASVRGRAGVEAAGHGVETDMHAATLSKGSPGVLHGSLSYLIQDTDGQVINPHSISAGLDYPGVGPEHAFLKEMKRAEYIAVTDDDALAAFQEVSRLEGIIPALETAHALAHLRPLCANLPDGTRIVVNFSGRGDKDVNSVMQYIDVDGKK